MNNFLITKSVKIKALLKSAFMRMSIYSVVFLGAVVILSLSVSMVHASETTNAHTAGSDAPDTTSAGDNNGFETTPTNTTSNNGAHAVSANTGTGVATDGCATFNQSEDDAHDFYDFGINMDVGGYTPTILGIIVNTSSLWSTDTGTNQFCIELSWNGGASWTSTAKTTGDQGTAETADTLGGVADTWGRTWTAADLADENFRLRVMMDPSDSTITNASLDHLTVRVIYDPSPTTTFSGVLYTNEGLTPLTGVAKTIKLAIGTSTVSTYSSTTVSSTGAWSISVPAGHWIGTSTPVTVWVDGDVSTRAALFTKAPSTTPSISGLDLYQNRVIVSHQGVATSTTLRDMSFYDSDDDADIQYSASSTISRFTVNANNELYIWPGKTFNATGTVTVNGNASSAETDGSLHIGTGATYSAGTTTLAGSFVASSTAVYTSTSTLLFNATTTGKTIFAPTTSLGTTTFNGVGGSWTFATPATTSDLTITNGTVVAPSSILTITGDYSNTGTFTHNSGTTTFANTGTTTHYTGVSFDTAGSGNSQPDGTVYAEGFFWIHDASDSAVYKYNPDGTYTGTQFSVAGTVSGSAWGLAYVDGQFLVSNYTTKIAYWYSAAGSYTGNNFSLSAVAGSPVGMTYAEGFLWVVSYGSSIYKYTADGTYTGTTFSVAGSGASQVYALTYAKGFLWLADSADDLIYKYNLDGTYTGIFFDTAGSGSVVAYGLTYANDFLWLTDVTNSQVYKFGFGSQILSGTMTGSSAFNAVQFRGNESRAFVDNASTSNFTIEPSARVVNAPDSLSISGNFVNSTTTGFSHGGGTTTLSGATTQTISTVATSSSAFYNLVILNSTASTTFDSAFTVAENFQAISPSSRIELKAGATTTLDRVIITGGSGTEVKIRSSAPGTKAGIYITGAYDISYVDVKDSSGSSTGGVINAPASLDSGNVSGWSINPGLILSGILYAGEGTIPISSKNLAIKVGTTTVSAYTATTNGSGVWSASIPYGHQVTASTPILIYIDGDSSARAAVITKALDRLTSITNLDLYQNRVIVRHEGSGTSTTLSDMSFYDSDDDSDVQFNASASALTVNAPSELFIWPGKTFIATGTVTINGNASSSARDGSLRVATGATYRTTGTTTLAGSLIVSSAGVIATSTILFNATTTGKIIAGTVSNLGTTTFNGVGGGWTFSNSATTTNLTITNGTVVAPANDLVITGNYSNSGTFTHNNGTTTFESATAATTYTGTNFDTAASGNGTPYSIVFANDFFWVVDGDDDEVYKYNPDGTYASVSFDTAASGNADPVAIAYADGYFWITDRTTDEVYKYTTGGIYTGTSFDTAGSGSADPYGITYANGYFWILDNIDAQVYKYTLTGTYTGTSFDTAASGNGTPLGITYANGFFWTTDGSDVALYKYTSTGTYSTSVSTVGGVANPFGLTYAKGHLWVTSYVATQVYKYTASSQILSGTMTGTSAFNNLVFKGASGKGFTSNASSSHFIIQSSSGGIEAPPQGYLSISGNLTNSVTAGLGHGWGTTTFNGASLQTITPGSAVDAFNHIVFSGAGAKTFSGTAATTTNFEIQSGSGVVTVPANLSIGGNYSNAGTFTQSSGTTTFNGIADQIATGNMIGTSAFYNLAMDGLGTKTFLRSASSSNFVIATTAVTFVAPSHISIAGDYTNSGTFTHNSGTVILASTTRSTTTYTGVNFDTAASGAANPVGIVYAEGFLWVVDYIDAQVYKYATTGTYTAVSFDTAVNGNLEPSGMTYAEGHLWITSQGDNRVYKYTTGGTYITRYTLDDEGGASTPGGITSAGGYLWVVDYAINKIKPYTFNGVYASTTNLEFSSAGLNGDPYGIVYAHGYFWVTDNTDDQVYQYTHAGVYTGLSFDTAASGNTSVFVDLSYVDGHFWIPDYAGAQVYKYSAGAQMLAGNMTGSSAFGSLTFDGAAGKVFIGNASTTDFTIATTSGSVEAPTARMLTISGNFSNSTTTGFSHGNGTTTLNGTAAQSLYTVSTSTSSFHTLSILNSTAPMTFSTGFSADEFRATTPSSTVAFAAGATTTLGTVTITGGSGTEVHIRSTVPGTKAGLNITDTFSISYVDVMDSSATNTTGTAISPSNSINRGNTNGWLFTNGLLLSGVLYEREGSAPITSAKNLSIRVGTSTVSSYTATTNGSGAWSLTIPNGHLINGTTPILVYVDGDTGTRAAVITKGIENTVTLIDGLDLYKNYVIVRQENAATSTSLNDLGRYDSDNDSDVQYTVPAATTSLSVRANNKLYIAPGDTFIASGTVTIQGNASSTSVTDGSLHLGTGASYFSSGTTTVGGSFIASSTAVFTSSSTLVLNATTTGKTLYLESQYPEVNFNGVGGGWTFATSATTSDLSITNGTLTAPSSNLTVLGNYNNWGTFAHNGGTVTFASTSATTTYSGLVFDATVASAARGITFANGYLWVLSAGGTQVYQYTATGTYTGVNFDTAASGNADPYGITYANGYFWITDYTDSEVYQYTPSGTYTGIQYDTSGVGGLNANPAGITYAEGFFWVTDYQDHAVYKYTSDFKYTGTVFSVLSGGVQSPMGIDYAHGLLWMVSPTTDNVSLFTTAGTKVHSFLLPTTTIGASQQGLTIANGSLWLIEVSSAEVNRFSIGQAIVGNMTGTSAFNNLVFRGGVDKGFGGNASATNLSIEETSGRVTAPNTQYLSISGNYTNSTSTGFDHGDGTTTFNGASPQTIVGFATNTNAFNHVVFTGAGTKTLSENASTTNFVIESGSGEVVAPTNLTIGGDYVSNGTFTAPSSVLSLAGSFTNNGTFTNNGGTVVATSTEWPFMRYTNTTFDTDASGNGNTYGITYADGHLWTLDLVDDQVYKFTTGGTYTGTSFDTAGSGSTNPYGITYGDGFFWVVDVTAAEVYKYNLNGSYTSTSFDTAGSGAASPAGIVYANGYLWIADYTDDEVYKYALDGTYTGTSFDTAASGNTNPFGMDYTNDFFWIQDLTCCRAYKYTASGTYTGVSASTYVMPGQTVYGSVYAEGFRWVPSGTDVYKFAVGEDVFTGAMTGSSAFNNLTFISGDRNIEDNASTTNLTVNSLLAEVSASTTDHLSITGNYSNSGTFVAAATTTFAGTSQQTATGTMTGYSSFRNLSIKNNSASTTFNAPFTATGHFEAITPSAKIELKAGATTTLDTVTITGGGSGTEVKLRSTTPGTKAGLSINDSYAISYVDVKDSSATSTGGIINTSISLDSGNNNGWSFPTAASIASLDNQIFAINGPTTTISTISIADQSVPSITAANDIRIKIATSTVRMLFDTTDTTATYGGTAAGKVSTSVTYEGGGSVLVIPVDTNFAGNDTLTISGLSFTQFSATNTAVVALTIYTDGVSDIVANGTDIKTVTITGSLVLADHTGGQVTDSFSFVNDTDVSLYAFRLTPGVQNIDISSVVFPLSGVYGVTESDLSNFEFYRDNNNDGAYDVGDTQIGGSGVVAITDQSGTVTFSTPWVATTTANYILVGDVTGIRPGDRVRIGMNTSHIIATDNVVGALVPLSGTVLSVQHIKGGSGSAGATGGDAPEGVDRGGGTSQGGGEIDSNTNGTSLGNSLGFAAPTSNGTPSNQWTSGVSGIESDGAYATAASTNLLQSYGNFGFSIPGSNQITGIEVKIEGAGTTAAGEIEVALTWNNGQNYTSYKTTGALSGTDTIYTLGSPGDTWGRSWTPAEGSNGAFQIVVRSQPSGNTVKIDAIRVRIYHQATGGGGGGGGEALGPVNRFLAEAIENRYSENATVRKLAWVVRRWMSNQS